MPNRPFVIDPRDLKPVEPAYTRRDPRDGRASPFPAAGEGSYGPLPTGGSTDMTEATAQKLSKLLYAILLGSGDHPITSIARTFNGSLIGTTNKYVPLYKNELGREIAVKIAMDAGTSTGAQVDIAFGNDLASQNKIDALYASGTVNSGWILLKPSAVLWVNTGNTSITCDPITLRVLLYDPVAIFGNAILP